MRILILGAGWLGTRLHAGLESAGHEVSWLWGDFATVVASERPELVINAAGKSGTPNVDWCEDHPIETLTANTLLPLNLAKVCAERGVRLLHLGSGCVFNGPGPFDEHSHGAPLSVYARTKYAADLALLTFPNVAIVRLRMPFDGVPHPRNLITKLAGYRRLINESNSLTSVSDLVDVVCALALRPHANGVFHAVNPGAVHHATIIELYRELVAPEHQIEAWLTLSELYSQGLARAPRSNVVLSNTRLPALGIHMRPTFDALRAALTEYATHVPATST